MAMGKFGWWLRDLAPTNDPAWGLAPSSARLRFWTFAAGIAAREWDAQVSEGRGADGRKLRPITAATRRRREQPGYSPMGRADPSAPPLTPCRGASRTRSLVRSRVSEAGVYFWWALDEHTGREWGEVLWAHKTGAATGRKRDVFGLAPARLNRVRREARLWWLARREAIAVRAFGRQVRMPEVTLTLDAGRTEAVGQAPTPRARTARAQQAFPRRVEGPTVVAVRLDPGKLQVDRMTPRVRPGGRITNRTGPREFRIAGEVTR